MESKTNIYFIGNVELGCVKVGKSKNPEKRLADLQVGNSHKLVLYGVMEDVSQDLENMLHKILEPYRMEGEWFKLTDEVIHFMINETDETVYNYKLYRHSKKYTLLNYAIDGIKNHNEGKSSLKDDFRKGMMRKYLIMHDKSLRPALESIGIFVDSTGSIWFYPDEDADLTGVQQAHYIGPDTMLNDETKKSWNDNWILKHKNDSEKWKHIKFSIGYSSITSFNDGSATLYTATTSTPGVNVPVIGYKGLLYDASCLE